MILLEEVIDTLHNARVAYIVTIGQENDVMAVVIGGNPDGIEPTPEMEIIQALDAVLEGEAEQPDTPQILSSFVGLYDDNQVNLN